MYSANNILRTLISNNYQQTVLPTVAQLLEGELGFFATTDGALAASGAGFFAMKKNGIILKSGKIANFAGWSAKKAYSAPVMKTATIQIPATPTIGAAYQINVMVKLNGMRGEYFLHGNFVAQDTSATNVATGLTASINAQLTREGITDLMSITSATDTITFLEKLQPYVKGKFPYRRVDFTARLTLPETLAKIETVTQAHSDGVGYGPKIVEQEYFAQGYSDQYRYIGWRNNYEWVGNALATGRYDVLVLKEANEVETANARVDAPIQYLIAFNTIGQSPVPLNDATIGNGDTTIVGANGSAIVGARVDAYLQGSTTSLGNATVNGSGGYSITVLARTTGQIIVVRQTVTGCSQSIESLPTTVA